MRPVVPSRLAATVSASENDGGRATSPSADPIVIRDHDAARRWLVKVIAARALKLYRDRRKGIENQANDQDESHGDDRATGKSREKRAG